MASASQPQKHLTVTPAELHDLAQIRSNNLQEYQLKCIRFKFHVEFGQYHLSLLDQLVAKQQLLNQKYLEFGVAPSVNTANQLQSEITRLQREIESERTELCLRQAAVKQQNPTKFPQ